jgi:signal transduction histidine kinase
MNARRIGTLSHNEILVIDDILSSLQLMTNILQEAGYTVRPAQDGEMALMTLKAKTADLILLDIRMPGIDGYEVCRRLKADPNTAHIPVIFLSALNDVDAKIEGFRLGGVDYISKPYQEEEVLARVRSHIELSNLRNRLNELVMQKTRELNTEIDERKRTESELRISQLKLRSLSGHLEDVREEERKRIARDLHDDMGQTLAALKIDLQRIANNKEIPRDKLEESVEKCISIVNMTAETARRISENLRPGMLDVLGLNAALEHLVDRFKQDSGISTELRLGADKLKVTEKCAITAFRVVQEALTNVAKHSQAKVVKVRLSQAGGELYIDIEDDGVGISQLPTGKNMRFGLMGMSERLQLLGGNLEIRSALGEGTRIHARMPVSDFEENEE